MSGRFRGLSRLNVLFREVILPRCRKPVPGLAGGLLLLAGLAFVAVPPLAQERREEVDVELVLAVDVSYSMDLEELRIQRQGYIDALTSKVVIDTIRGGMTGKIGVTYFEWAGSGDQQTVAEWAVIEDEKSAQAFAGQLDRAPIRRARRTSVSGAIEYGVQKIKHSPFRGIRRVIDISGDGVNNQGTSVTVARDRAVEEGITINGLPLILPRAFNNAFDVEKLDEYYRDCVIGGPGSFLLVVREREQFGEAIRAKLLREIAQVGVRDIEPVQERNSDCSVGERMWRERWERWGN